MRVSIGISTSLHVSGYLYSVPPTIHYFSFRCPYVCLRRDVNPYVALAFSYVVTEALPLLPLRLLTSRREPLRCPYVCLRRDVSPYVALTFAYVAT